VTLRYAVGNRENQPGFLGEVQAGADGRVQLDIDSSGYAPGLYRAFVGLINDPAGRAGVASVPFTITSGAAPGLPNTGGGGGAAARSGAGAIAAVLGALVVVLAGAGIGRRLRVS
jgi:hypothetical protein